MEPISDERLNAAYQRILNQMGGRHSRAEDEPGEPGARQQHARPPKASRAKAAASRKTPPNRNHGTRDGHGVADPQPSTRDEGTTAAGRTILLAVARTVLGIIWTVAYCVLVKPICRVSKFAFLVLAVLGLFALMAAWVINASLGGLHALHVWACDEVLPDRLFFVNWCDGITTTASPPLTAAPTVPGWHYSPDKDWTPLTPAEMSLLQKPDRHFCVFGFGDLLGGMADEQRRYMTGKQRESFAVMSRAGSVVGQLQEIGRKQSRTVERAQEKMIRLMHNLAARASPLPKYHPHPPPPLPPPPPAWFSAVWFTSLFAGTRPYTPSMALEGLVRDMSRVLNGELTSRKQFAADVTGLSQEMGEVASSVCGWNTALEESISDKTHRLREVRRRIRPKSWWWWPWRPWATRGSTSEMLLWEDQAKIIRNEIIMWRRRKAKANLVCKILFEGASKTAKLLKAIQDEEMHLGEMAQGAADLVAEVSSRGGQASDDVLQRWSKTARDLGVNYLQSFRLYYSKA